jgi:ankyrin repeat protein
VYSEKRRQENRLKFTWSRALENACKGGHREIAEMMIQNGAVLGRGLTGACMGGNHEFVNWILSLGCTNYDNGLLGACAGGNDDLTFFMIELGANDFKGAFIQTAKHGQLRLGKLLAEKYTLTLNAFNLSLGRACCNDDRPFVDFCIDKGCTNWDYGLRMASACGNVSIIDLMIEKGGNLSEGLMGACAANRIDIVKLILSKGASVTDECLRISKMLKYKTIFKLLSKI